MIELAGCVILNDSGEILLLHRSTPELTQWELPGGKNEPDESLEDTAMRETKEELGVEVSIVKKLGRATFSFEEKKWLYSWFKAKIVSGNPYVVETNTFDDLRYWPLESLKERTDISLNISNILDANVL